MSAAPDRAADERFMRRALEAAVAVAGRTGDNPAVGCVVVHRGRVVAEGATQPPPGPHAEAVAVRAAEARGIPLAECEVYVTLEPCSFQGRTPPCAALLAERRPRRVVVALEDPHPRVSGAGLRALRAAGVTVVVGVLEAEARKALAAWTGRFVPGPDAR